MGGWRYYFQLVDLHDKVPDKSSGQPGKTKRCGGVLDSEKIHYVLGNLTKSLHNAVLNGPSCQFSIPNGIKMPCSNQLLNFKILKKDSQFILKVFKVYFFP